MCFPYLFRGALDTRAKNINEDMKMAAALALANLAREPVPDVVRMAYEGRNFTFGKEYIIPTPFDPRLLEVVSCAVAEAAEKSGSAQVPIRNWEQYLWELRGRRS